MGAKRYELLVVVEGRGAAAALERVAPTLRACVPGDSLEGCLFDRALVLSERQRRCPDYGWWEREVAPRFFGNWVIRGAAEAAAEDGLAMSECPRVSGVGEGRASGAAGDSALGLQVREFLVLVAGSSMCARVAELTWALKDELLWWEGGVSDHVPGGGSHVLTEPDLDALWAEGRHTEVLEAARFAARSRAATRGHLKVCLAELGESSGLRAARDAAVIQRAHAESKLAAAEALLDTATGCLDKAEAALRAAMDENERLGRQVMSLTRMRAVRRG